MSLKVNTVVNYLGQGWVALMGLAFIPVYIHYLGIEAWGLVGFMSMMQAWLSLLDLGLTPTLSREMARFSVGAHSAQSIRNLLRSMELIYGAVSVSVVASVWLAAPWLASQWLKPGELPKAAVVQAITMMGLVLASRMAEQVYRGAIQGLQHLVWLNGVQAVLATVRWAGAVAVLAWGSPTIEVFFAWQGFVSLATLAVLAMRTYRWLPKAESPARFDRGELRRVQRFAGGMVATTLLALLLTQMDKLLLSRLLPLQDFGYYVLAASVASTLSFLISPLSTAIAPRLTELVTRSEQRLLVDTYHRASQWMAVILIPPALVLANFAEPALWAWTGNEALALEVAPILALLAVGTLFNGFMNVPYVAQLAHGSTGFVVRLNAVAVVVIVPAIFWAVPRYGAIGAAWVWLGLNVGYVVIGMHFMHRTLFPAEKWIWYRTAIIQPLAVGAAVSSLLALSFPRIDSRPLTVLMVLSAGGLTFLLAVLATPEPRAFFLRGISSLRRGLIRDGR
jgi:O-antigen/teichoic acid export membrane protein